MAKLQDFLKCVENHTMKIILNSGENRHIRFQNGDSNVQKFDLVSFDDHLVYSGDMGSFVFKRSNTDMFLFFTNQSGVNEGYWQEKLVSIDARDGVKEFVGKTEVEIIIEWAVDNGFSEETIEEIKSYFDGEFDGMNADEVYRYIRDFKSENGEDLGGYLEEWVYENEFTYRFLWACYAIQWGCNLFLNYKRI